MTATVTPIRPDVTVEASEPPAEGYRFVGCASEKGNRGMRTRWEANWVYVGANGRNVGGYREVLPLMVCAESKETAEAWAAENVTPPEWGS